MQYLFKSLLYIYIMGDVLWMDILFTPAPSEIGVLILWNRVNATFEGYNQKLPSLDKLAIILQAKQFWDHMNQSVSKLKV